MTTSSCIRHPENQPLVLIRKWQVEFCDNHHCAAALLSFFEFFHGVKENQLRSNRRANDIAERHGDPRFQEENLYQYHTKEELSERLLGLYGKTAIMEGIRILCGKGVVTTHRNPNPRYSFDNTVYYQFHPDICNGWIAKHFPLQPVSQKSEENSKEVSAAENSTIDSPETATRYDQNRHIKESKLVNASSNSVEEMSSAQTRKHQPTNFQKENSVQNQVVKNQQDRCPETASRYSQNRHIDLPEMIRPSSENGRPSTENSRTIYRDLQTEITSKETAAAKTEQVVGEKPSDLAAAGKIFPVDNLIITSKLTDFQHECLQKLAQEIKDSNLLQWECADLEKALEISVLDTTMFTQAGTDFIKKLNTLRKYIRLGKWSPPVSPKEIPEVKKKRTVSDEELEYARLIYDKNHWTDMLTRAKGDDAKNNICTILKNCDASIKEFLEKKSLKQSAELASV